MLRASQTSAIAESDLQIARANMTQEQYDQEFECSFDAVVPGSYYGREIAAASSTGRVLDVPYDPALGVTVAVDLGMRDAFACWFLQEHPLSGQVRAIDYREFHGKGLPQVKGEIDRLGYAITQWQAPHDIEVRELGTGHSRIEVARTLGMEFHAANAMAFQDGVEAVRLVIPRMVFDRTRCEYALDALRHYHAKVLEEGTVERPQVLAKDAEHDWSSHCADALRTYATSRNRSNRTDWTQSLRDPALAGLQTGRRRA
jgi:hypothetical protein